MPVDPRAPCIIGVARRTWREEPAPEPLILWETLAREAARDASSPDALSGVQSLQVVFSQSWEYDDPCARLAQRLGTAVAMDCMSLEMSGTLGSFRRWRVETIWECDTRDAGRLRERIEMICNGLSPLGAAAPVAALKRRRLPRFP